MTDPVLQGNDSEVDRIIRRIILKRTVWGEWGTGKKKKLRSRQDFSFFPAKVMRYLD